MFTKFKQRRRAGRVYEGPACWCDDYGLVPRPGFYALDPSGKTVLADVPLVMVDDAGEDPWDGSCHYEYAGPNDNPTRQGRVVPREERLAPPKDAPVDAIIESARRSGLQLPWKEVVEFEIAAEGRADVAPAEPQFTLDGQEKRST